MGTVEAENVTQELIQISTELANQQQRLGATFKVVFTLVLSVVSSVGLIGNGVVAWVVLRSRHLHTPTNIYLVSLALTDFIYSASAPLFLSVLHAERFLFGEWGCKVFMTCQGVNWFAGTYTLLMTSVDRHLAVVRPLSSRRYRTPQFALAMAVAAWCVGLVATSPVFTYATAVALDFNNATGVVVEQCIMDFPHHEWLTTFTVYTFVVGFLVPSILISILYITVITKIRHRCPSRSGRFQHERRDSPRRITRMVLLLVLTYVALWGPYWSHQMIITLWRVDQLPGWLSSLYTASGAYLLTYANCACDPLLYAFLSQNFRFTFLRMCPCCLSAGVAQTPPNPGIRCPAGHVRNAAEATVPASTPQTGAVAFRAFMSSVPGISSTMRATAHFSDATCCPLGQDMEMQPLK